MNPKQANDGERQAWPTTPRSRDEIESDIARTRAAISTDLQTLGERLEPSELSARAQQALSGVTRDVLREARGSARRAGESVMRFLAQSALPLTMITAGIVWLIGNARRKRHALPTTAPGGYASYDDAQHGGVPVGESFAGRYPAMSGQAGERMAQLKDRTMQAGHELKDRTMQAGHELKDRTMQAGQDVLNEARYLTHQTAERARAVSRRGNELAVENPLATIALAALAGVGIGLLLPRTRAETRLVGPRARELSRELERSRRALSTSAQQTKEELKRTLGTSHN